MAHEFQPINPARFLTPDEKAILYHLLSVEFQGREELLRQAQSARVTEECKECHSIVMVVDDLPENMAPVKCRVPVHAQALDLDNGRMHILLHVVGGFMDEMEIYREDLQNVRKLPEPTTLEFIDVDNRY
jgi:hypothetical protein